MSQAERLSKIHSLLQNGGRVTMAKLTETFEVSRATIMRDIELMRDRLGAPIVYDRHKKSYAYDLDCEYSFRDKRFNLPGMWIDEREGYALLTLLNITSLIDPALLMPYTGKLKMTLKTILSERRFPMKGFHRKVAVDLPNLKPGNMAVLRKVADCLVNEKQATVTWLDQEDRSVTATVSLQRYVLGALGWRAEFIDESTQMGHEVALSRFIECIVEEKAANLLPAIKNSPETDREDLLDFYFNYGH